MNSKSAFDPSPASANTGHFTGNTAIIRRMLLIIPAIALLCLVVLLALGRTKLSESGKELVIDFAYSALIALPSTVVLTRVSHRFAGRSSLLLIPLYATVLVCTATFGILVGNMLFQLIGIFRHGTYWREFWSAWPFGLVVTMVVGLSITYFETLRYRLQAATLELRTRQVEQERANKLLVEARLSSLESRIHPHFLFNTLNSIASLIPSDPQRAEDTVAKLASLLRFSLNANHSSLVPLAQELKIVRDYLEIESTRFGARLRYSIDVSEDLAALKVPPLALQTLVENSVKHVAAQRNQGAVIQISGSRHAGRLQLKVIDDGPGFSLAAISPEHGLGNLVTRLDLLFGDRAQLDVHRDEEKTVVAMTFPAEA
jgi:two-component system, LytTR family, sensor histidine kinase AlgZ